MKISLIEMKRGSEGTIIRINGGWGMISKLYSMGIREGKKIKKLSQQFMRGPVIVQINNSRVAIGFGMARRIFVEIEDREG